MDERRETEVPVDDMDRGTDVALRDMEQGEREPVPSASTGLSTADLVGTAGSPTREQQRVDMDGGMQPPAASPSSDTPTVTMGRAEGALEPPAGHATVARSQAASHADPGTTPLFSTEETHRFRSRWQEIQTGFVDEPRRAVEQADGLVAELMKELAQGFADERSKLESQWERGEATETEGLRQALRRYRSFFDRLLSI
jgi:hypothetical protein